MKPTLEHKPNNYAYQNLKMKFADGVPLSADELNFLAWHEKTLSHPSLDPVFKYYLKHYRHDYLDHHSFLSPDDKLDTDYIKRLKQRLSIILSSHGKHVELKFSPEEFLQFRSLTMDELILYHGNQLLTGAPFYPGGVPQIIFFQWGNLFGVAKYVVLAEERALKSNVLIYFEDKEERDLETCIHQYLNNLKPEVAQQLRLSPTEQPAPRDRPFFTTPTLTLSPFKKNSDEE